MRGSKLAFVRYNSCFAPSLFVAFFLHFFVSFIRCCVLSACASLPVYLSMVRVCLFSVCLFCHHVSCRFSSGLHVCVIPICCISVSACFCFFFLLCQSLCSVIYRFPSLSQSCCIHALFYPWFLVSQACPALVRLWVF